MVQEAAADVVISLLQTLEDNNNQDEIQLEIMNSVNTLEQAYMMSVTNEDLDRLYKIIDHFINFLFITSFFFIELSTTVEYLQN